VSEVKRFRVATPATRRLDAADRFDVRLVAASTMPTLPADHGQHDVEVPDADAPAVVQPAEL
jgi:hypothetical protein